MSFYGVVGLIVVLLPEDTMGWNYKIVTIGLVLLTLPFALIIMFVASRRSKKRERREAEAASAAEAVSESPAQHRAATPSGSFGDLNTGAEEVVQFLKSSDLGEGGRDAVYSLPWYLVAGAPKAGKSSLVISSNLNFKNLPSQRQSELRTIRPTPNIDWRISTDAVFIDTAGRYQTEGVDGEEWSALLETIKKYRGNRPIDGFILVVNAETILKGDEREVEELAKVLRARLDDAISRLKVRFPVYLVFTHSDTIEGFRDSFSSSKNEDKTLVWGATIPLEKSENAQALFDGEYEILQNSIMKRRSLRLSAPFPPLRQLRIFNFPLHFSSARRRFGSFVNTLFRPSPFSENPFLRGFYFTAAPASSGDGGRASVKNGFFTERLMRDVFLRDKDLVRTFIAQRQKPPILGWFLTILGALIVVTLLALSAISLITNKQMLGETESVVGKAITLRQSDAGQDILAKQPNAVRAELDTMGDLRDLASRLDRYEREGAPLLMRFGMYSGNRVLHERVLPIYFRLVETRFAAPTVEKIKAELKKFSESPQTFNVGKLSEEEVKLLGQQYNLLKAYLMLTSQHADKAESTHLVTTLKDFWLSESKVQPELHLAAIQHLEFWARQVDRGPDRGAFRRTDVDKELVENARKKLQAFPPVQRYYRRMVTEISKQIDDQGETTVSGLLSRRNADSSLLTGTVPVQGVYTRAGYELMKKAISEAPSKLTEEDWVIGDQSRSQIAQEGDTSVLNEMYLRDYADQWRAFVKGVDVVKFANAREAESALLAFSQANSPIEILAVEIAKNTNLSAPIDDGGWISWIKGMIFGSGDQTVGSSQPEKDFRPLFDFVGKRGDTENAPITRYRSELALLARELTGKSDDEMKRIATEMSGEEPRDRLKIGTREKNISGMLSSFNDAQTPGAQEMAIFLQKPIDRLKALLGADAKSQLAKAWTDQILPAAREIEKGYPFEDGQADADLTKLTEFLAPNKGKFSEFYDKRLSSYFEEVGGQLRLKENAEVKFTDEFVSYLNNAMNLRRVLFGSSETPKFEYEFKLRPITGALVEATIDGTKATSEGTGAFKGTFPGSGAELGVLLNLASTSATTGSSDSTASSGPEQLKFAGVWGVFRFVDAGKPQKQASGEYVLTHTVSGKSVTSTIRPSGGDLFDKSIFRQVKAPDSFIK